MKQFRKFLRPSKARSASCTKSVIGAGKAFRQEQAKLIAAAVPDLVKALQRIRDGAEPCECAHSDENCCALQHPVDFVCPYCIADIAIKKAGLL